MLQKAIVSRILPLGITKGLIVLLYKDGGCNIFNNWCPIILLNVYYKLFAKALQIRLQHVLIEIIFANQSDFLSMRYILENIFIIQETIMCAKQSNQPVLFLKLYFFKTYDKVDLAFLFQSLEQIGFSLCSLIWPNCSFIMLQLVSQSMVRPHQLSLFNKGLNNVPIGDIPIPHCG